MRSSMEIAYIILKGAAVAVAAAASFADLKTRKIPNNLTFSAMSFRIGFKSGLFRPEGAGRKLFGDFNGFCSFYPICHWRIKSRGCEIIYGHRRSYGMRFCGYTIVYSIIVGGAAAFVFMLLRKSGRTALKNLKNYFVNMFYTHHFYMYQPQDTSSYFSFGCCILVGLVITWLVL